LLGWHLSCCMVFISASRHFIICSTSIVWWYNDQNSMQFPIHPTSDTKMVMYLGVCMTYRWVLDWWPDLIAHNYRWLFYISPLHIVSSVSYTLHSHFLVTDFNTGTIAVSLLTAAHMKSSFHSLIPFLPSLLNHSIAISRDSQFWFLRAEQ
jgi:hypothetical protein